MARARAFPAMSHSSQSMGRRSFIIVCAWLLLQHCQRQGSDRLLSVPVPTAIRAAGPSVQLHRRHATSGALQVPGASSAAAIGRRTLVVPGSAALLSAALGTGIASAEDEDNAFSLELKSQSWRVKKEVREAIRVRREQLFEATDSSSGATVVLTRTPLGASRKQEDARERIFELAGAFDPQRKNDLPLDEIIKILTLSLEDPKLRRAKKWVAVKRGPQNEEAPGPGGQRYVYFDYDVQECTGTVTGFKRDDGSTIEDCDGKVLPWRRHFIAATVLPTKYTSMRSSYLDGSLGLNSRIFDSLWLLDASVPVKKINGKAGVGDELRAAVRSFSVQPAAITAQG